MDKIAQYFTIILTIILCSSSGAISETGVKIVFLTSTFELANYREMLKREIGTLLNNRFEVRYETLAMDFSNTAESEKQLQRIFDDGSIDCIVGVSLNAAEALARWNKYTKPVIAGAILDRKLQGLPITENGTSGIANLNYVQSPFDIEKDLKTFKKLIDFSHLAILYSPAETNMFHYLFGYLGKTLEKVAPQAKLSMVEVYPEKLEESIDSIPADVDAVYLSPLIFDKSIDKHKELITLINQKKLPSFALLGEAEVQMGAMASIAPDQNMNAISRRVALNVLNILSGQDAADLPVSVMNYNENFVVNIETLQKIGYYPDWDALNDARLVNIIGAEPGLSLNIRSVIYEALQNNLDLQIKKLDTNIQEQEALLAKGILYPKLNLSSSFNILDENRADGEQLSPARYSWVLSGNLTQTIFSDDAVANLTTRQPEFKILIDCR